VFCDGSFTLGDGIRLFVSGVGVSNYPYNAVSARSDTGQLHIVLAVKVRWQVLQVGGSGHCALSSVV